MNRRQFLQSAVSTGVCASVPLVGAVKQAAAVTEPNAVFRLEPWQKEIFRRYRLDVEFVERCAYRYLPLYPIKKDSQ